MGILFAMLVGVAGTVASLVFFIALAKGSCQCSECSVYLPADYYILSFFFWKEALHYHKCLLFC